MPKNPKCTQRKGCICFNVLLLGSFHRRACLCGLPWPCLPPAASLGRLRVRRAAVRSSGGCGVGGSARSPRLVRPRLSGAVRFSPVRPLLPFRGLSSGGACAFCGRSVGAVSLSVSVLCSGCAVPRALRSLRGFRPPPFLVPSPRRGRARLAGVPSRLPYPAPLAVFPRGSSRGARQPPYSKTGVEITPVTTAPTLIASARGSLCRLPAPLRGHLVARGLSPAAGIARTAQRFSVLFPLRVPFRSLSPCIFPPRTPYFFLWDITHY